MKSCPYCENAAYLYFTTTSRNYFRCLACDLIYLGRRDSYAEVVTNYSKDYFERYSIDQLEGRRARLYDHILDVIAEGSRGVGSLLDVGTGCGFFLVAAQKSQWEAAGIEPSIQSVEVARRRNSLDVFAGTLKEYAENKQFDVITFINVLDHLIWPWQEIDRAKKLLRPGGLIYLRFPNGLVHSQLYRAAKNCGLGKSLGRFLVSHEYSFTPKYIRKLFHDHGFIQTTILNSPPSEGDPHELFPYPSFATYVKQLVYLFAKCTEAISCRRLLMGPSLEATAVKSKNPHN